MLAVDNCAVFGASIDGCIFGTKCRIMFIEVTYDSAGTARHEIVPGPTPDGLGAYNLKWSGLWLLDRMEFKVELHDRLILFVDMLG